VYSSLGSAWIHRSKPVGRRLGKVREGDEEGRCGGLGSMEGEEWVGWGCKKCELEERGSYYDDGGLCNVISAEYLTGEACEKMMAGQEVEYDYYVETLTLSAMDGEAQNSCFCIGGMSCRFCLSLCSFER
jgi:hypothetical protein